MSIGGVVRQILYIADDDMFPVPFNGVDDRRPDYAEVHIEDEDGRVLVQRVRNPSDRLDILLGKVVWGNVRDVICSTDVGIHMHRDICIAERITTRDWKVNYKAIKEVEEQDSIRAKKEEGYVGLKNNSLRVRRSMDFGDMDV